jgi:Uma2 family endonuclease
MATATLKKRRHKPKTPALDPVEELEEDRSASFFMPAGSMTLDDFRRWTSADDFPENGKIAYIGKEIFIDMSPERIDSHGSVKVEAYTVVGALVRKKKKGQLFFDRTRVVHAEAVISNEPDAFFASWATLRKGGLRRIRTPSGDDYIEFEGTPDWILEIVSPSSVTKDKKLLRGRYHRAGISEHWLIDARGEDVDFQILIHGKDEYEPAERAGDWQVSQVFGKKFRLRRITDELGDIDYRLDVK